jgi:hypothetical protein
LPEDARLPRNIQESFTCRKSTTWDRRLYFPSEGRRVEDFFALKNPTASVGTIGQHATSRPPKPLSVHVTVSVNSDTSASGPRIVTGIFRFIHSKHGILSQQVLEVSALWCYTWCFPSLQRFSHGTTRPSRTHVCSIFFCFARGTYISTMFSFSETSCIVRIKYFVSKNTHLEPGGYKYPFFKMQIRMLSYMPCTVLYTILLPTNCRALHCVSSHFSSCLYAFRYLLTPSYGAPIELQFLHKTSDV